MKNRSLDPEIKLDELELKQVKAEEVKFDRLITTEQLEIKENEASRNAQLRDNFDMGS